MKRFSTLRERKREKEKGRRYCKPIRERLYYSSRTLKLDATVLGLCCLGAVGLRSLPSGLGAVGLRSLPSGCRCCLRVLVCQPPSIVSTTLPPPLLPPPLLPSLRHGFLGIQGTENGLALRDNACANSSSLYSPPSSAISMSSCPVAAAGGGTGCGVSLSLCLSLPLCLSLSLCLACCGRGGDVCAQEVGHVSQTG